MVNFSKPTYAVLGLGRFGTAVARELVSDDAIVIGVDLNEMVVNRNNGILTQVVQSDTTDIASMTELGIADCDGVVVGIGGPHVEASILTCSVLNDMGVKNLWAKSSGTAHGRILEQIGVPHIVHPEVAMGRRVAHLVRGVNLDYVELSEGTAMVRTVLPLSAVGPLDEIDMWDRHGVKIVALLREGQWQPVLGAVELSEGDQVQIYGSAKKVEKFARSAPRV